MFWTLSQNNSGGHFWQDDNVDHYVIIEADDYEKAENIAHDITFESNSDYCPCCGSRWYIDFSFEEGTETPEIYGEDVFSGLAYGIDSKFCIIHYKNGTCGRVDLRTGEIEWIQKIV